MARNIIKSPAAPIKGGKGGMKTRPKGMKGKY